MAVECFVCRAESPEGKKYCGDCGTPLHPNPAGLREILELDVQRRIDSTLKEQFKDQKLLELETAQAIATRLSDWAKLLGFFIGIPLALLIIWLGVMGVSTYSDFTKEVEQARKNVVRDLKEVEADASSLKKTSTALKEEYGRVKSELDQANKLRGEVEQINEKIERIEQKLIHSPTSNASPDTKSQLESSFRDFQRYLGPLGFRPKYNDINVDVRDVMPYPDLMAYYEDGNRRMVINSKYAGDPDILYREYMHHVLYSKGLSGRSGSDLWAYSAVESALATYFACSYNGRSTYAEKALGGKGWNLENKHSFNDLKPNANSSMVGMQVWGNVFWEIRNLLKQPAADALLFRAWFDFQPQEALQGNLGFAKKLMKHVEQLDGGKHASKVRALFRDRDLAV